MLSESVLDAMTSEAIHLLSDLIRIPALSKAEDQRADFLHEYLLKKGLTVERIGNNLLIGSKRHSTKKRILLNSHIDTVKAATTYTLDPHLPLIDGDKLYGLGSNDAGASVVALLMTYLFLSQTEQSYEVMFVASAEEEISGQQGIIKVIEQIGHMDLAVVGEPTGMDMAVAEKGLMVIDGESKGQSGHAAREEGINAIYLAMQDIEWIKNFKFEKISDLLGFTKATVTMIQAGNQHNVIPDLCRFVIDVRSNERYSNEEIHALLQSGVQSTLHARSYRLQSSAIALEHPIVQKGLHLGLKAYGSPTLSDQALIPFTSIKIGPGQSSRSHTADEYVLISELRQGIKTYIELLDGLSI